MTTNGQIASELVSSFCDVLIFTIDRNYCYEYFNEAFSQATNTAYGTEVKMGVKMLDNITSESDRVKAKENCDIALGGKQHITVEGYGNPNVFFFETRYYPRRNKSNEVTGVSVMSFDVTERELAKLKVKEVMDDMESFSYSVSHDLRAPLRAIIGFSEILEQKSSDKLDSSSIRHLSIIKKNAKQMGSLIDDLLEFSRMGRVTMTPTSINLDKIVKSAIKEIAGKKKERKFLINSDKLGEAICDPKLIKQVWLNLISNAIKYSGNQEEPSIHIGSAIINDQKTYFVKDNGVGFDMEYSHKLFGVFERLHSAEEFEGTGVGLSLVKRIIDKHGGQIWAESQVNHGATFFFTLPEQLA